MITPDRTKLKIVVTRANASFDSISVHFFRSHDNMEHKWRNATKKRNKPNRKLRYFVLYSSESFYAYFKKYGKYFRKIYFAPISWLTTHRFGHGKMKKFGNLLKKRRFNTKGGKLRSRPIIHEFPFSPDTKLLYWEPVSPLIQTLHSTANSLELP